MDPDDPRSDCLRLCVHDLNNPLTAIRVLAELCRDTASDPELRRDMVDMLEAADAAGALLEGLSSLLRAERNSDAFTWHPIDLSAVVREIASRPALGRYVTLDLPPKVRILGDRTAIARAVTDVMMNARRLAERSAFRVTLRDQPVIELRIRHPAPGVPATLRQQLFEPYGAVALRGVSIPVSVVGLYQARQAILAHEGEIFFEDDPSGAMDLVIRLPR
ncbi:MAG: HAMP domain-containing sensor histidine kinase [Myxococcota bacterium]